MTRLIDLDDDRHTYCGDDGEYEKWNIDPDVPTVEAVPVEYIRALITELDDSIMKYVGRFDYSASVDSWIHRRGALEGLIAEWEEE